MCVGGCALGGVGSVWMCAGACFGGLDVCGCVWVFVLGGWMCVDVCGHEWMCVY